MVVAAERGLAEMELRDELARTTLRLAGEGSLQHAAVLLAFSAPMRHLGMSQLASAAPAD